MSNALLNIDRVSKAFDGTYALKGVNLEVFDGECVAVVGENGAGKSTLMKILSGVWPYGTYEGEITFQNHRLALNNTLEGRTSGISIIHQELCLFPELTVAENLFLTEASPYTGGVSTKLGDSVRWNEMYVRAEELLSELGFAVPARATVKALSVAQRQLVEIAKAFHHQAKLLILDEPTSALSAREVKYLFEVIERMKGKMTFIYISHKLDEVFHLADRIIVMRDGQSVVVLKKTETNEAEVIRHMVGRPLKNEARTSYVQSTEPIFAVENLSHLDLIGRRLLKGVSFAVRPGEILGIAGLMGSGRSELLRSILGILPGKRSGSVFLKGKRAEWFSIREAMASGIGFVPEDRKKDGLFLDHSIGFNLTVSILSSLQTPYGTLELKSEEKKANTLAESMRVKFKGLSDAIRTLSGGNQQKVLLAKVVALAPKVLFLDEPTRGIDIGAKEEIYSIIRELAKNGIAVVVVSSELPEVLTLSDRVLVLREGEVVGQLENTNLTQEKVMSFAAGGRHGSH